MDIVPFRPEQSEAWDAFVEESRNGTLFHLRRFLAYHPPERFQDASLMVYDGTRLAAVLPAAEDVRNAKHRLLSHPGATLGGLVLSSKLGITGCSDALAAILSFARSR